MEPDRLCVCECCTLRNFRGVVVRKGERKVALKCNESLVHPNISHRSNAAQERPRASRIWLCVAGTGASGESQKSVETVQMGVVTA